MKLITYQLDEGIAPVSRKRMLRNKKFRFSLKARVALGVATPIFVILACLSFWNYSREYQLLDEQARLDAVQLGDIMIHSLNHAMLTKEDEHLLTSLIDISKIESVRSVQIIGMSGKVLADSHEKLAGKVVEINNPECISCHQKDELPRVVALEKPDLGWRIATPVENLPQCHDCHEPGAENLGVLLMDISLTSKQEKLLADLQVNMVISVVGTFMVSVMSFILTHHLVVRRIASFLLPLSEYADGNFNARIPYRSNISDELCDLAATFNQMADELARQARLEEDRQGLRERAIVEERERIARELHDGFAQVLGYLTTKVMAVRLLVKDKRLEEADHQLGNLENAARNLFSDVREAILGLKMAGNAHNGLIHAVQEYVSEFARLSGIPCDFMAETERLPEQFPAETALNLFRIIQEALNNVRKHAQATHVLVQFVEVTDGLEIIIADNGVGFTYPVEPSKRSKGLGLGHIQDRVMEIGARLEIQTQPNVGTTLSIKLDLREKEYDHAGNCC